MKDERIDGTRSAGEGVRIMAQGAGGLLVGHRDVGSQESFFPEQAHHVRKLFRRSLDADVARTDARGIQSGLLHGGRFGMGDGEADHGQSGGNGFSGIKRMFFIQKIGQGVVGFHGKIEERAQAFTLYYE